MVKLTIEDDEGATREVELEADAYDIGRDASCGVCLPERTVSKRHARLERDGEGRFWFVNLDARYGSSVNGMPVEGRVELAPTDVVQIGGYCLGLSSGEAPGPAGEALPSGEASPRPWEVLNEPDQLLVFGGPDDGVAVRLDGGVVTVGVGEGVTVRLPEGALGAGVHALVRPLSEKCYEVAREGGAIGLEVRLERVERALLDDGDLVRIEGPGGELVALRFSAARRVCFGTPAAEGAAGKRGRIEFGLRLAPSALPDLGALKAELSDLPLAWRLEGESLWPKPSGYSAPRPSFTDMTDETVVASCRARQWRASGWAGPPSVPRPGAPPDAAAANNDLEASVASVPLVAPVSFAALAEARRSTRIRLAGAAPPRAPPEPTPSSPPIEGVASSKREGATSLGRPAWHARSSLRALAFAAALVLAGAFVWGVDRHEGRPAGGGAGVPGVAPTSPSAAPMAGPIAPSPSSSTAGARPLPSAKRPAPSSGTKGAGPAPSARGAPSARRPSVGADAARPEPQ